MRGILSSALLILACLSSGAYAQDAIASIIHTDRNLGDHQLDVFDDIMPQVISLVGYEPRTDQKWVLGRRVSEAEAWRKKGELIMVRMDLDKMGRTLVSFHLMTGPGTSRPMRNPGDGELNFPIVFAQAAQPK